MPQCFLVPVARAKNWHFISSSPLVTGSKALIMNESWMTGCLFMALCCSASWGRRPHSAWCPASNEMYVLAVTKWQATKIRSKMHEPKKSIIKHNPSKHTPIAKCIYSVLFAVVPTEYICFLIGLWWYRSLIIQGVPHRTEMVSLLRRNKPLGTHQRRWGENVWYGSVGKRTRLAPRVQIATRWPCLN